MVRQLYIILLALHPAPFRYRFAFEMLAIYDEALAHGSTLPLLADGIRSLICQWVHPYRPVAAAAVPASAGTPVFYLIDTSLPKRRHLMTGATLSLVLFIMLAIQIGRGGRSPGILLIGAFRSWPSFLGVDRDSIEPSQPTTEVKVRPAPSELPGTPSLDPRFSFGVLDLDGDGMLSAAEMASAPAVLRTLGRDHYGNLSPHVPYLVLVILDRDRDGIISSVEISRSTAVLRALDTNRDGTLVQKETFEARRAAAREYDLRARESRKVAAR
jgi:hypothetical protein